MTAETIARTRAAREALSHLRDAHTALFNAAHWPGEFNDELDQLDAMMRRLRMSLV
jgi:hypothetical protein